MVYNLSLKALLILALACPYPAFTEEAAEPAPNTTADAVDTASITLPVADENGEKVDELNVTVLQVTSQNQQLVISTAEEALGLPVVEVPIPENTNTVGSEQTQSLLQRLVQKTKQMRRKDPGVVTGLVVAATSSALGGVGLYYFGGSGISESVIIGTTMLGIAVFHGVFTNQWQSYLKTGLYIRNLAGLFKPSLKDNELVRSVGNIAAAAAFNIAPTAVALHFTDSYTGLAAAAAIGALGAYDYTIDIAAGKMHRRGYISETLMKRTVRTRMLFGPVLEMFSIAGHASAQIAMGGIAAAGLIALLRGESLMQDLGRVKRMALKVTSGFSKCTNLLDMQPPKIYVRVAYEDTM